jgi:hypothetical protein
MTAEIIHEQGWKQSASVDTFWRFPIDCSPHR